MTRVLLPALYYAKQDRDRGLLSEEDAQFVGQATREILDVLAHDAPAPSERDPGDNAGTDTRVRIVGCPARDEADVLALEMVRHLLDPARYRMEVSRPGMLVGRSARLGRPAPPRASLHRGSRPRRLEPGATSLQAPAFAMPGAQDRGRSLGPPRRKGYRSPAPARGRRRSRRNDGARYTADAGLVGNTLGRPAAELPPAPAPELELDQGRA